MARLYTECRSDIAKSDKVTACGGSRPRCAPRTLKGCRCKATWSHTSDAGAVTTFENHRCGNPYDGGSYKWWHNDWCNIVPGSCAEGTFEGLPGTADDYLDGEWYDNCGTGEVDPDTGAPAALEQWTTSNMLDVTEGANVANSFRMMQVILLEVVSPLSSPSPPPALDKGVPSASPAHDSAPAAVHDNDQSSKTPQDGVSVTSGGVHGKTVFPIWKQALFAVFVVILPAL